MAIILIGTEYKNKKYEAFSNEIENHPRDLFAGKSFITDTYPVFKDVMFVGDSYTHRIASNLGFDVTNYSCPGLKLSELEFVFNVAATVKKKYVVIFIGPNDFISETKPSEFGEILKSYVDLLRNKTGATVIVCTYLNSQYTLEYEKFGAKKYTINEYNNEIMKLNNPDNKIYYFDVSSLNDVYKYAKIEEDGIDKIHFNYDFYVAYINKLYDFLTDIRFDELEFG